VGILAGRVTGLKPSQIHALERLQRRRVDPRWLISPELARELAHLSHAIGRQLGLLLNRAGQPTHVLLGEPQRIVIPSLENYRAAPGRLCGLRCIHTHLHDAPLDADDLADLSLLRLDLMAAIQVSAAGEPQTIHAAHLLPNSVGRPAQRLLPPLGSADLNIDCRALLQSLEAEMAQQAGLRQADAESREGALLVSVSPLPRRQVRDSMAELEDLAHSAGIAVIGTLYQQRRQVDPRTLMGQGKLQQLAIAALEQGATLIIFDQDLNPSQLRSITERMTAKVIDRTQLILDIFAQRARSREGRLQVELAQLKYLLPRLVTKNTAMSRLTGGIGGRGPGETKLEINRRRARERIGLLEKELERVSCQRAQQKSQRLKKGIPVISIVGYTNAGKSTLLNSLTGSRVAAENRLFATLDPSSRRLRFPRDLEVIVTDTVGFIRELPRDLLAAFRATLEELQGADLLLHVIDVSNPRWAEQVRSVERILAELSLEALPCLRVLNKIDRLDEATLEARRLALGGVAVSALAPASLEPLVGRCRELLSRFGGATRPMRAPGAPETPESRDPDGIMG
jgi:GTP-binding protein HflX